jgi:hypothetical protein
MRIAAIVVLVALALGVFTTPSSAQVPNIQVYFDDSYTRTQVFCRGIGVLDRWNVVANNFNMIMSTIEFAITPPPAGAAYTGDKHRPGALWLGVSPTGVTITYPQPLNAFEPVYVMRYQVVWLCDIGDCDWEYFPVHVIQHPGSGLLQAVEHDTFRIVQGVGMTSFVCAGTFPTEETTWGRVKALYR